MRDVVPADTTYAESLARIASVVQQAAADEHEIEKLAGESFRAWLDRVVQRAAEELGIAIARARALIDDFFAIAANAATAFRSSYKDAYRRSRQVHRRDRE